MWVSIEEVPSAKKIIYIPSSVGAELGSVGQIIFGNKSVRARVQKVSTMNTGKGNSFENPVIFRVSSKLRNRLLMPDTQVYRVRFYKNQIVIGPVIGLLLGIHNHVYNPRHMKKYSDRFGAYSLVGGLIYAFSPKTVDWEKKIAYGLYYNIENSEWEFGSFPLPSVVYRRDFHSDSELIKKLVQATGNRLFNSYRFTKFELFKFVEKDNELKAHLPPTELTVNYHQVRQFIDRYGSVILKPIDLSRGRGICIVKKIDRGYKIIDYRNKEQVERVLEDERELENFFAENKGLFSSYLIQRYISLAKIDGSFFDIRVVMQKNSQGCWECSGIECRVSAGQSHLTNISRGGYALCLSEALQKAFPDYSPVDVLAEKISRFCSRFCMHMDTMGEHFAEFGMDVAVDTDKNLWLIEANVFPSFKGFKHMNYDTYLSIRYAPLLYALSLTEFGEENGKGVDS